jgi:anti-sigma factor RsiW
MDKFVIRNLEGYLSGQLGEARTRDFEAQLAENPNQQETVTGMTELSGLFDTLALPDEETVGPAPGFPERVLRRIEEQRKPVIWDLFLEPVFFRRVAVAACAWLLLLVSGNLYQSSRQPSAEHLAEAILAEPPRSADYCGVRLGCDLQLNRNTMLAAVMISGRMVP